MSHNLQKWDHQCVRVFGVGHWVLDEFFKMGVIGYHVVKQGVIRYWREQKKGSIYRHMMRSHIITVPPGSPVTIVSNCISVVLVVPE